MIAFSMTCVAMCILCVFYVCLDANDIGTWPIVSSWINMELFNGLCVARQFDTDTGLLFCSF